MALQDLINAQPVGTTLNISGQTFNEPNTILLNKRINILATGATLNSGVVGDFNAAMAIAANGLSDANPIVIDGLTVNGAGHAFVWNPPAGQERTFTSIRNCTLQGQTGGMFALWTSAHHITFFNCVMRRTAGTGQSTGIIRDNPGTGTLGNIRFYYCDIDNGTLAQGHYGIEAKYGDNCEVAYCKLRGGNVLISLPDSQFWHMHHNDFDMTRPAGGGNSSGPQWSIENAAGANHTIEYNWFHGSGPQDDGLVHGLGYSFYSAVTHNTFSANNIIRRNRLEQIYTVVDINDNMPNGQVINNYVWLQNAGGNIGRLIGFGNNSNPPVLLANNDQNQKNVMILRIPTHKSPDGVHRLHNGEVCKVQGVNFGVNQGTVTLGGQAQNVVAWTDTEVTFIVTQGAMSQGNYDLIVSRA